MSSLVAFAEIDYPAQHADYYRPLSDADSLLLEKAYRRECRGKATIYHKWSKQDDKTLRKAKSLTAAAKTIGVSYEAARSRRMRLRGVKV